MSLPGPYTVYYNSIREMLADRAGTIYMRVDPALYRSTDAGASWTECVIDGSRRAVVELAVGRPGEAYVVLDDYRVFATRDAGVSWQEVALPFKPDEWVHVFADENSSTIGIVHGFRSIHIRDNPEAEWRRLGATLNTTSYVRMRDSVLYVQLPYSIERRHVKTFFEIGRLPIDLYEGLRWWIARSGAVYAQSSDGRLIRWQDSTTTTLPWSTTERKRISHMVFSEDDREMVLTADSAMYRSLDSGRTWTRSPGQTIADASTRIARVSSDRYVISGHDTVIRTTDGGNSWHPALYGIRGSRISNLIARDGIVFGRSGNGLLRGDERGMQWRYLPAPSGDRFVQRWARSTRGTLFAITGYQDLGHRSTDAGVSWQTQASPPGMRAHGVAAASDGTVIMTVTSPGTGGSAQARLLLSSDDGTTWDMQTIPSSDALDRTVVDSAGAITAVGKIITLRTTDRGATWKRLAWHNSENIRGLAVQPDGRIFLATLKALLRYDMTTDRWETVDTLLDRYDEYIGLVAPSYGHVLSASIRDGVRRSTDNGDTWHSYSGGLTTHQMTSLTSDDDGTVYAASATGMYRLDVSAADARDEAAPSTAERLTLHIAPSHDGYMRATLNLPRAMHARVTLHDMMGREVAVIHDDATPAGVTLLTLPSAAVSGGAYVLSAITHSGRASAVVHVAR